MAYDLRTSAIPAISNADTINKPNVLPEFGAPDTIEALRDRLQDLWDQTAVLIAQARSTEVRYPERFLWETLEALNLFDMSHGISLPSNPAVGKLHGDYSQPDIPLRPLVWDGEDWVSYLEDIQPGGSMLDVILAPFLVNQQVVNAGNQELVNNLRTELRGGVAEARDTLAKLSDAIDAIAIDTENLALTGVPTAPTAAPGTSSTQLATTAFVSAAITALIGGAPATLDTLNEIAAALADDENIAATLTALIGTKIAASEKGAANGVATLDGDGKVPSAQISAPALVNMPFEGDRSLEYFGLTSAESALNLPRLEDAVAYGKPLAAEPYKLYPWEGRLLLPGAGLRLRGNGAVFKPFYTAASGDTSGQRYALRSNVLSQGASYGVSYVAGERVVELDATPTDLEVGNRFALFSTSYNGRWPICYRIITAISGAFITLDQALTWDMRENQAFDPADPANSAGLTGVVTGRKIPFGGDIRIEDAVFDLSGIADGTAEADGFMRLLSYDTVDLDRMRLTGLDIDPTSTDYLLYTDYSRIVRLRSWRAPNCRKNGSLVSCFRAEHFLADDIQWSGRGFGLAPVQCDSFSISRVRAAGDQGNPIGGPDVSVRAIRPIGCLDGSLFDIRIRDYDSGVKLEDCANIFTSHLITERVRVSWNVSSQNPGYRDGGHTLSDFNFRDYRAYGISAGGSGTGGGKFRTCLITNGVIETSVASASEAIIQWGGDLQIDNVRIPRWPSGKSPFRTVTADGVAATGSLENFRAITATPSGRLGIEINAAHTSYMVDPETVRCNAPGGAFAALPPNLHARVRGEAPRVMVNDGTSFEHTGNTSDTTLKTLTLPGGCLGPNGFLRIRAGFKWTNNANNKIIRVRLGAGVFMSSTVTTNQSRHWEGVIFNRNSESAQVGPATIAAGQGDSSGAANTSSVNTAADFTVSLTGELANSADMVGVDYWSVEAVYGA